MNASNDHIAETFAFAFVGDSSCLQLNSYSSFLICSETLFNCLNVCPPPHFHKFQGMWSSDRVLKDGTGQSLISFLVPVIALAWSCDVILQDSRKVSSPIRRDFLNKVVFLLLFCLLESWNYCS